MPEDVYWPANRSLFLILADAITYIKPCAAGQIAYSIFSPFLSHALGARNKGPLIKKNWSTPPLMVLQSAGAPCDSSLLAIVVNLN